MKHFPYFLLVAASLLVPTAAHADGVENWRYDPNQNRLEFTTDRDVQPTAQLIADPTRLVIDLPGVVLGRPAFTQPVGSTIRAVRIGQFDRQTTRLVVELAPGYTMDPSQVRFRGITARQWTVQLPTPQPLPNVATDPGQPSLGQSSGNENGSTVVPTRPTPPLLGGTPNSSSVRTRLENVRVTGDGFFIRTSGSAPAVQTSRSADRRQITIDLPDTALGAIQPDLLVNRYGVNRIQVSQLQTSPSVARITLNVNPNSPDWQATASNLGGVVVVPAGGLAANTIDNRPGSPRPSSPSNQLATIEAISLTGSQLVIRANQPLRYTTGWDRPTGMYRLTINSARLSPQVRGPQLTAGSPIVNLRLRQEDSQTVVILLQPASGVQISDPNQPGQQTLALQLQRGRPVLVPPTAGQPPIATIPVPPAPRTPTALPPRPNPNPNSPRVPNGRIVVIVDPGHGGPDPGAIGIGGIQEKEIVLDISRQVATLLEQQGVQAVLTRNADIDLDLEPRVQMAERMNATVFVSIHANSIDLSRPDVNGLETYYYDSGEQLARTIHQSVLEGTGVEDRRVRSARFYVLRKTSMPSVLVEVGFVTGRNDAARLSNPTYRSQMASSIVRGILQYIQRTARY